MASSMFLRFARLCNHPRNRGVTTVVARMYSDEKGDMKNSVHFGGIAKKEGGSLSLQRYSLNVSIFPNKEIADDFKAIENEMLVKVSGKLGSKTSVVERGGRFTYQKQHYIQADSFEIIHRDELVEKSEHAETP